jgi:antitoxin component YwqK of YwqJK toxin-antitoxin module
MQMCQQSQTFGYKLGVGMRSLFIFLLVMCAGVSNAQNCEYTHNDLQFLNDAYHYEGELANGMLCGYYKNEQLKFRVLLEDGLEKGIYTQYYEDGKLKLEAMYEKGLQEGTTRQYYENGNLKFEDLYKNGVLEVSTGYYESGKLEYEATYENNVLETRRHYNESGSEYGMFIYEDGKAVDFIHPER